MRRLFLSVGIAALAAACAHPTAPATGPRTTPAADTARVETLFADEFDGAAIDRAKWEVYTGPVYNNEVQEYVDDTATMRIVRGAEAGGAEGGALLIRAVHRPGAKAAGAKSDLASGRLHGRQAFLRGTVSARMKLPAGAGFWPAFWILGVGSWPEHGEIDVMENVGDPRWVNAALHGPGHSGNTPLVRRDTFPPGSDVTAWHVYSAEWAPDFIAFAVDGAEYYRVQRGDVTRYGPAAVLDSVKYVILNLALGGGYPAAVNGVQSPHLGLPQSTVDLIDADKGRVLVDWVRWTRRRN